MLAFIAQLLLLFCYVMWRKILFEQDKYMLYVRPRYALQYLA